MPIYDYQCRRCGEVFDQLRSVKDNDRDVECPVCGEKDCERLMSLTASDLLSKTSGACGPSRPGRMRFG